MRTFIAVDIPKDIRERVAEFQEDLKKSGIFIGSWTKDYHITLKFLGDVSEEKVEEIKKLQLETEPFEIDVKGFGAFPSEKFIRVIWIGTSSAGIKNLQKEIEAKLSLLGFEKERREFNGHLTLCRVRKFYKKQANDLFDKYKAKSFGKFKVKSATLMESKLTPVGPVYGAVKTYMLG